MVKKERKEFKIPKGKFFAGHTYSRFTGNLVLSFLENRFKKEKNKIAKFALIINALRSERKFFIGRRMSKVRAFQKGTKVIVTFVDD